MGVRLTELVGVGAAEEEGVVRIQPQLGAAGQQALGFGLGARRVLREAGTQGTGGEGRGEEGQGQTARGDRHGGLLGLEGGRPARFVKARVEAQWGKDREGGTRVPAGRQPLKLRLVNFLENQFYLNLCKISQVSTVIDNQSFDRV